MRKPALGKVTKESYQDFMSAVDAAIAGIEQIGVQERAALKPENEPSWSAYEALNALGYYYAAALVRAAISDLDPASDSFPEQLGPAIQSLEMLYQEANERLDLRDESVIRQAAAELPHVLPSWIDLEELIEAGQASYEGKGVYIRDFYHNMAIMFGEIMRALQRFQIEEARPELVSFRREGAGGEYVPAALFELDEEEERTLLKTVIQEANRRIGQLTFYGLREEEIPTGDFTIIQWLNGPAAWRFDNLTEAAVLARSRGLERIKLDANMALIPFHTSLVTKVMEAFDELPLYVYSIEAKERGEYPEPTDRNVKFAIRSMVEQAHPELDSEEKALQALELFELFRKAKAHDRAAQSTLNAILPVTSPLILPYMRLFEQWMKGR